MPRYITIEHDSDDCQEPIDTYVSPANHPKPTRKQKAKDHIEALRQRAISENRQWMPIKHWDIFADDPSRKQALLEVWVHQHRTTKLYNVRVDYFYYKTTGGNRRLILDTLINKSGYVDFTAALNEAAHVAGYDTTRQFKQAVDASTQRQLKREKQWKYDY